MMFQATNRRCRVPLQAGMSRVEILLGIVVLAILVSVAGVPGSAGHSRALDTAESRIRAALELASSLSRSSGNPHGVSFEVGQDRLAVLDVGGRLASDPLLDRDVLVDLNQGKLTTALRVTAAQFGRGRHVVVFDGRGVPLAGGRIMLEIGESRRELVLDGATGWLDVSLDDTQR